MHIPARSRAMPWQASTPMKTQFRTFLRRSVATILSVIQVAVLCVSGVASAPQVASAAIPATVGYQGRLKNTSGSFLTGTYSFTFRIYDALTGGAVLWTETQPTVTVESGVFIVRLGSVTPFPTTLDFNQALFLATEVNADGEMSPRVTINSVPYAYTAGGVSSNAVAPTSTVTGGRMFYNTSDGSLQYYDDTLSIWRALGTSTATAETLQSVTNRGSATTNAIQFAGGTSTGAFTVSSALTVTGTSSLQNLTFTNATGSSVFATNGTFTNLFVSSLIPTNLVWTNATGTNTTSTNAFITNGTVTNATSTNLFATNASIANLTLSNPLTVTGITWTNATGTNTTSTNLFATNFIGSTGELTNGTITSLSFTSATGANLSVTTGTISSLTATGVTSTSVFASSLTFVNASSSGNINFNSAVGSSLIVNGQAVCLANGTNCPSSTASTFQAVTNAGNTTTNAIQFAGGTSTRAFTVADNFNVTGTVTVSGNSSLQGVTFTNATATNVTTTNLGVTGSVDTALAPSVDALLALGSSSLRWNGFFANTTSTNATTTNLFATNFHGVSGTLTNGTITSLSFTSATGTNFLATSGTISNLRATNVTTTNILTTNATTTNLTFTNGTGTNLVIANAAFTNTTSTNLFATNAAFTNLNISSLTVTSTTPSSFTNIIWTNATGTNTTSTNLFATTLGASNATISSLNFANGTSTGWFGFTVASGSSLFVQGQQVCLANGMNCPSSTAANLQTVTNAGNTTTNAIQFAGGTSTATFETSAFIVDGGSGGVGDFGGFPTKVLVRQPDGNSWSVVYQNDNADALLPTSTAQWAQYVGDDGSFEMWSTNFSGGATHQFYSLITPEQIAAVGGSDPGGIYLPEAGMTLSPFTSNANDLGLANASWRNIYASGTASTFYGANFTQTTTTNATTTNLFASRAVFTNGTSTGVFNFNSASGTSLSLNGQQVCLANGTNCPSGTAANFQTVTNAGNTTTNAIQFAGGTSTGDFVPSSDATLSFGSPALRWNGNFANLSGTSFSFVSATGTNFLATSGTITNLTATNVTSTNTVTTNLTATNATFTTFAVAGSAPVSFTNLTWTNATGTNTTSTNLFATNNFFANSIGTNATTTNFFATSFGATTATITNVIANAVTSTSLFSTSAGHTTLNVSGASTLGTLSATAATATTLFAASASFTNSTSTGWFGFNVASGSSLFVQGQAVCLANGMNCPSGTSPNFQTVTNSGNTTTNAIQFAGGTSTGDFVPSTDAVLALGSSGLRWNGNFANLSGTSISFISATGTNFLATSGTITNLVAGTVTSTNAVTTNLSATNATFTTFVVTGSVPVSFANLTWTNATGTNTTSTNLFATNSSFTNSIGTNATSTNFFATTAAMTSVSFANGTSTGALSFNTASGSSLFVQGQAVCLANGTNCPAGSAGTDTLLSVTNRGSVTTATLTLYGGVTTANLTATGTTNLQAATFTAGTGTSLFVTTFGTTTGTATTFTTTNLSATDSVLTNVTSTSQFVSNFVSTAATSTNSFASSLLFTSGTSTSWFGFNAASGSSLIVNGQNVCLQNGTNCPVASGGANFWAFDATNDILYPATSTSDLLVGGATTATAPFRFFTANTSSRMYVGAYGSSTNIVLGGPTSTVSNTAFQLSGGSMFASASFGAASSVYTNGAFIAATTTLLSKGFLTNSGNFAVSTTNNGGAITLQPGGGFVKVGSTIAPQIMFEVGRGTNGATLAGTYEIGINSSGRASFGMVDSTAGVGELLMGFNSSIESLLIGTVTNHPIFLQSNHVIGMNLDTNGFLGVGMLTQTPVTRLEVNGITSSTEMSSGRMLPHRNNIYDLGSATRSWANIYASGTASLSVVSSTDVIVNGQRVCLADGTNCAIGATKSASSTANAGLNGTETELLVVTSTLTNVTSTVFISADMRAVNTNVLAGTTIAARIRRGACTTGFQVGVDRVVEVALSESEDLSLSFVDTPATTTAVGYRLCAVGAGGTPQADERSMVVEIVKAGSDLAEMYFTSDRTVGPGDVVAIDPTAPALVKRSEANDNSVIGVISTRPGSVLASASDATGIPVLLALAGRVPVKASLENGDILPGDALAPASIPGYVMKATAPGVILGRALSGFSPDLDGSSRGQVLLFIQTGYYFPSPLSVQTEQSNDDSNALEDVTDSSTEPAETSVNEILSDEGLSVTTEDADATSSDSEGAEENTVMVNVSQFDVQGVIDGILDSIKKLVERILGIEAKLEQQQQEIDELRAKVEAIQPQ